ncbi:A-kinase anchor protein 6 isoform B [Alligator mississippiensis]|uniref:A-kinase anchor protein 6 n=1 Tax=Alligator mississippiensis TaxID=8496 RepID=A0A151NKF6_ALLMI|nr:A-kinase anchor protein 6 isoform B [Alligator mississippiensis]
MATDASPMLINMTPTTEQNGEDVLKELDSGERYEKPPPLHTGADWKIVLHLPEIETWLRMTSERVRDLTYSVQQDLDSKHVDVHLVQLKDICEDISDHVEQIHALLETEFSLKLLSYSVNVIVDIHTVQLLWHQLRVSVLVLRERILQGLQDANGNYTRQTDILQAFSEETKEDRLDSLTEVDDSGQLTIKCSQNYLSLDCGITAFELSDYSPSEDLLGALDDMTSSQGKAKPFESWNYSEMEKEFPEFIRSVGLLAVATDSIGSKCDEAINVKETHLPLPTDDKRESKDSAESPELSLLPTEDSFLCQGPDKSERISAVIQPAENSEISASNKSALIHQLMQDIQHQDNYEMIWEKIEGFVSKLDEFIHWLNEAMETTENWTPPKAETDSLKLYLETHLSFKLNVDSHCALKEAVVEEGRQLLELIVSHKSEGLKDMLQMIASQWKELQRQIKRQHSWILRALDIIKAEILATDVSAENEEGTGSPKAEVQLCYLEAQRDAVEQMSLKLYSEQYNSSSKRKEEFADMSKVHTVGSNGLLDFDSEYQELWDWLIDMESIVMDSHDLMMSEEQQQHLYKRYNVEMSIRHPKKMELLSKVEALKKSGVLLPNDLLEKVDSINEKWELLGKTLGEKIQDTMVGHSGLGPRDLLSPESGSLVRQLEVRIKELKGWLRDTELFIFNSCLRQENEGTMNAEKQLQYFKSLCCEIKQRRRGVASVLRLCQHLLDDQETCNLNADHQSMQLIIVNLERRWEAIVMQAVQWQTRLQKRLGKDPESLNVIDPGLMDLNGSNEDALEWDETDISNKLISINEDLNESDQEQKQEDPQQKSGLEKCDGSHILNQDENISDNKSPLHCPSITSPSNPHIYQLSLDIASSINEDSAGSLTELSSSEDLSLCSEDIVLHRNKVPDSNASFRKHLNRSVADESDVNVSMIVNVSCTSACTDDEDDSDLLSSSTLTLTEEELGIKDEDDDSSIATDEDIYEECNLISGLDYIKNELQTWIRPKFSLSREKRKGDLSDEIQRSKNVSSNETSKGTDTFSIEMFLNGSVHKLSENNGNSKNASDGHGLRTKSQTIKNSSQTAKEQFVDDMENETEPWLQFRCGFIL